MSDERGAYRCQECGKTSDDKYDFEWVYDSHGIAYEFVCRGECADKAREKIKDFRLDPADANERL